MATPSDDKTLPGEDEVRARDQLRALGASYDPLYPDEDWWPPLYGHHRQPDREPAGDEPDAAPKESGPARRRIRIPRPRPAAAPARPKQAPAAADPEADEQEEDGEEWEDTQPADESTPEAVKRGRQRQQIRAAWTGLRARHRWLISTAAGAGIGWAFGLEQAMTGWIADCSHQQSPTAGLILGLGIVAVGSYLTYRTRAWWPPLAWTCRVPLATAILALALYAPGAMP